MTPRPSQPVATIPRALRRPIAAAALALAVILQALAPAGATAQVIPTELPEPIRGMELVDKAGEKLPLDLVFTDSGGNPVKLADLFNRPGAGVAAEGRPVVIVMMYFRCPLLCPKVVEEVLESFNNLDDLTVGTEYDALFVSFDPRDTSVDAQSKKTDALLGYNRTTTDAIRSGMSFLTAPAATSRALADSLGFPYRFLPDSGEYSHSAVIYVVTPDGTVSRALTGLQFPARDLRLALVEAADGRIGSLVDRFVLWCYHFDPREGSYVLQAMRVMRLGGAITVVLLGTFVGVLFLNERRRRRYRDLLAPDAPAADAATTGDTGGVNGAGEPDGDGSNGDGSRGGGSLGGGLLGGGARGGMDTR